MAVAPRVFIQIVLMIALGAVEVRQGLGFDDDRGGVLLLKCREGCLYRRQILRVGVVDPRAVLVADVTSLLVERRGVDGHEVELEELAEVDLLWGIDDVYGLGEACRMLADLLVGRCCRLVAISIAYLGGDDSPYLLEEVLGAPEAPSS